MRPVPRRTTGGHTRAAFDCVTIVEFWSGTPPTQALSVAMVNMQRCSVNCAQAMR